MKCTALFLLLCLPPVAWGGEDDLEDGVSVGSGSVYSIELPQAQPLPPPLKPITVYTKEPDYFWRGAVIGATAVVTFFLVRHILQRASSPVNNT